MKTLNLLSKSDMKKIMGGSQDEGGCLDRGCTKDSECGGNCPKCVEVNPTWGTTCATSSSETLG
ncbi:hypothetical protein CLV32_1318 [Pedobacter duraquae]|uniref:Uncharacterized protein n=1 Tax=Pedobacter duraquae TaxID=425511 RepID=A0A4R6IJY1_9SPHI|nr:hypothetical protein CLV32_1318 [Pedobacter duraquae]